MRSRSSPSERSFSLAPTDPAAPLPPQAREPGLVLAGRYELVSKIGEGGMGEVWRAQQLQWNSPVAVKLPTVPDTPAARERFDQEVALAAAARGSHVVQVFEHGIDRETNIPYIAMEYLEGETLSDRRRRLGTLSPPEVMLIITFLGKALTRAHKAGVIHRDLKPGNVFCLADGDTIDVKVLDFGVAKSAVARIDRRAITVPGNVVGTAYYISPEQIRATKELDHRADLWSLAIIACECLTGRRPFDGDDLATLAAQLDSEDRPVPSRLSGGAVPAGFDAWFAKGTARNIADRFQSADELVAALKPICGSKRTERFPPILCKPPEPSGRSIVPVTRTQNASRLPFLSSHPKLRIALVAAPTTIVSLTAVFGFYHFRNRPGVGHSGLTAPVSVPATLSPPAAPEVDTSLLPAATKMRALTPAPVLPPEPQSGLAAATGSDTSPNAQSAAGAPNAPQGQPSPGAPVSEVPRSNGSGAHKKLNKPRPPVEATHPKPQSVDTEERIFRTEY
jgi:serine/threonine protein kinase